MEIVLQPCEICLKICRPAPTDQLTLNHDTVGGGECKDYERAAYEAPTHPPAFIDFSIFPISPLWCIRNQELIVASTMRNL